MNILKPNFDSRSHTKAARIFKAICPVDLIHWKLANNWQERIAAISIKKSFGFVVISTAAISLSIAAMPSRNLTAYAPPPPTKDVRDLRQAAFKEFKKSPPQALIENNRSIKKGLE